MATAAPKEKNPWTVPVGKALDRLAELKINFLALDFDQTLVDIHTGGVWKGTVEELSPHVRPMFRTMLQTIQERNQRQQQLSNDNTQHEALHVAIVTFSSQVDLIRHVLEGVVGPTFAHSIPIRGGSSSSGLWAYHGQGSVKGKQAHMASAVEELESRYAGLTISKTSTLLVDDDSKNIRAALQEGVRAIWLNPRKSAQLLKDMLNLM